MHNHQLTFDDRGFIFPKQTSVIVKASLGKYPLVGTYLRLANCAMIDRKNRTSAIETMNEVSKEMKSKNVI